MFGEHFLRVDEGFLILGIEVGELAGCVTPHQSEKFERFRLRAVIDEL
jgi:hypothetical protein